MRKFLPSNYFRRSTQRRRLKTGKLINEKISICIGINIARFLALFGIPILCQLPPSICPNVRVCVHDSRSHTKINSCFSPSYSHTTCTCMCAVKLIFVAQKFQRHEIFNVSNFSSLQRTTKIRYAENLIAQKVDYVKIS